MAAKNTPVQSKKVQAPQTPITTLQQQSMRNFLIIIITITTLVAIGGGYLTYRLVNANIKKALEVRAQEYYIKLAQNKKDKITQAEPILTALKKANGDSPSDFEFVTQRSLPATTDFEGILTVFNTLEKKQLINVESISRAAAGTATTPTASATSAVATAAGVKSDTISIKASGARDQIIAFLRSMETSARIFNFNSMKLSGDNGSLTLDMQYEVYYLPKPSDEDKSVPINEYEANKGSYQ